MSHEQVKALLDPYEKQKKDIHDKVLKQHIGHVSEKPDYLAMM